MTTYSSLPSRGEPPPERPQPPGRPQPAAHPGVSSRGAHHTERPRGVRPPHRDQRDWTRAPYSRRNDRRRWRGDRGGNRRYDQRDRRFGSLYDLYSEPSSRKERRMSTNSQGVKLEASSPNNSQSGGERVPPRHPDRLLQPDARPLAIPSGPSGDKKDPKPNFEALCGQRSVEKSNDSPSSTRLDPPKAPASADIDGPLVNGEKMDVIDTAVNANQASEDERPKLSFAGSGKLHVSEVPDVIESEQNDARIAAEPFHSSSSQELSRIDHLEADKAAIEYQHDPKDLHEHSVKGQPTNSNEASSGDITNNDKVLPDAPGHDGTSSQSEFTKENLPNPPDTCKPRSTPAFGHRLSTPASLSPQQDDDARSSKLNEETQGLLPQEIFARFAVKNRLSRLKDELNHTQSTFSNCEWSRGPVEQSVSLAVKAHVYSLKQDIASRQLEFKALRSSWEKECADLDNDHRNIELEPLSSSNSNRRSRGTLKDGARTEQEFQEILANLELQTMRDPLVRARLTSAAIPPMVQDPVRRQDRFIGTNNYVENVPTERVLNDGVDDFSPDEHELFCEAYIAQPKQFGAIAQHIPGRNFNECVMHYYRTKKRVDYKQLVLKKKRRQRKRDKPSATPTSPVTPVSPATPSAPESHEKSDEESKISEAKPDANEYGRTSLSQGIPSPVRPLPISRRNSLVPKPVKPLGALGAREDETSKEPLDSGLPAEDKPTNTHRRRQRKSHKKLEQDEARSFSESHTDKMDTLATLALLDSTVLSTGEQRQLDTLVSLYGSRFDEISRRMNKPESTIKLFVEQNADKYNESIVAADTVNSRTGVLPLYVPKKSPTPPPLEVSLAVAHGNGPSIGFFSPRKRQVPMIKQQQYRSSSDPLAVSEKKTFEVPCPPEPLQPRLPGEPPRTQLSDGKGSTRHSFLDSLSSLPTLPSISHMHPEQGLLERDVYNLSDFHIERYRESNERG